MDRLLPLAVTVSACATAVYLFTLRQVTDRRITYENENQDNLKPVETEEQKAEETAEDLLASYWAGGIPHECEEILDMLRFPEVYKSFGTKLPKGLLLYGEPGTGKTYFGKMLAELANAHFFYAAASQMDEIYVGSGPKKIRALFEKAKKAAAEGKSESTQNDSRGFWSSLLRVEDAEIGDVSSMEVNRSSRPNKERKTKSIIFLDELDSLGVRDELRHGDARHSTLSQLLACMDGVIESDDILVVAATNYLDGIDAALTRSGRFDRMIKMGLPTRDNRLEILRFYLKKKPGGKEILNSGLLPILADAMEGFNAADVSTTVNEATVRATRDTVAFLKKRHLKGSSNVNNTEVPAKEPENAAMTENHLIDAFWAMHGKISRERPRPELLRKSTIDDLFRRYRITHCVEPQD